MICVRYRPPNFGSCDLDKVDLDLDTRPPYSRTDRFTPLFRGPLNLHQNRLIRSRIIMFTSLVTDERVDRSRTLGYAFSQSRLAEALQKNRGRSKISQLTV